MGIEPESTASYRKNTKNFRLSSKKGKFVSEDFQEACYFNCDQDLRIQRNKFFAKIWLKIGSR